jgi:hypothetical protein
MTDTDDTITKAVAALKTSVKSIIDDDDADEVTKSDALVESLDQCVSYLDRNHVELEKVEKAAKGAGQHSLAAALIPAGPADTPSRAARFHETKGVR